MAIVLVCTATAPAAAGAQGVLKLGAHSPRVAAINKAFHRPASRAFGVATRRAVKRFQRRHDLTVDGIVGAQTWRLIKRIRARQRGARHAGAPHHVRARHHATRHRATRHRRAHHVSRASRVKLVQRALHIVPDGVFGPITQAAVRRLQRRHRMKVTGIVGPKVWDRIGHPRIRTVIHLAKVKLARTLVAGLVLESLPARVRKVVSAANQIATAPYVYGGGHGNFHASGYDCSGSVSYALWGGGLLQTSLDSSGFMAWGMPGPGRWITIYANPSHAFMQIGSLRFDTSGENQTGSRWQTSSVSTVGYVARHPQGL